MSYALGIIDVQRGFMPLSEGDRLHLPGFAELPVEGGEKIIAPINSLIQVYQEKNQLLFTTQDWHPTITAHFSSTPDYQNSWPIHCVQNTPGALLHPDIHLPTSNQSFYKGQNALISGEQDLSYSGLYSQTKEGVFLTEWIQHNNIIHIALVGLALDYCVQKTAFDLKESTHLNLIIIEDATKAVSPENIPPLKKKLQEKGMACLSTLEWLSFFLKHHF